MCTHDGTATGLTHIESGRLVHLVVCEKCGEAIRVTPGQPYTPQPAHNH